MEIFTVENDQAEPNLQKEQKGNDAGRYGNSVNIWQFEPTKEFPTLNNVLGYGTYLS
jgi:hypothetical protein